MATARETTSPTGSVAPRIRVGTSGWAYDDWQGAFYPPNLPSNQRLPFYREYFSTVEVNATFYRIPPETTLDKWREQAGEGFPMAVKGNRHITHTLRLRDCETAMTRLFERLDRLGDAMGPVVWGLPADLERDDALLADFASVLPSHHRHAIEFRHESWFDDVVYSLLDQRGVATVAVSAADLPAAKPITGGMLYLRLHGLKGDARYNYSKDELRPWSDWARAAAESGTTGFVFFGNDRDARAPANALEFIRQVGPAAAWSGNGEDGALSAE